MEGFVGRYGNFKIEQTWIGEYNDEPRYTVTGLERKTTTTKIIYKPTKRKRVFTSLADVKAYCDMALASID